MNSAVAAQQKRVVISSRSQLCQSGSISGWAEISERMASTVQFSRPGKNSARVVRDRSVNLSVYS